MSWFRAPEPTLPDLIALNSRWRPGVAALVDGEERLSWRAFDERTAQVAHALRAGGLAPGARVALLMDNSAEMALAIFGIVRAGLVAVPLNVSISDGSVASMAEDAEVRALFACARHAPRLDALGAGCERIAGALKVGVGHGGAGWMEFGPWIAGHPTHWSERVAPDAECNIIYSSGTTGVPKGILHTHRCRMRWATDLSIALRYRSGCVTLCSLGLYSNISWVGMLCTTLVGGTMVLSRGFDPAATIDLIGRERITHGNLVPVQLERLLAVPGLAVAPPGSLETVMCCGSPLAESVKRAFPARFGCELIELYGLTEGLCTVLAPEDFAAHTTSVGKPVCGTDLRILGDDDREVACGESGEIVGLSPLVMAGYHRRDAASAEATWTDPHGRRWLRTGDIGRVDADGFLYLVDRKKDMILSGGQNIYPADIELVMRGHPDVADVAVVGVRSRVWGETPVAVVVRAPGAEPSAQALLAWTNERLGRQQRIRDVLWRDSLPRNPNGKVLKRELRLELADRCY